MENMRYTVGTYVIKTEKKSKGDFICPTCINCKDKSVCSERKNKREMNKCEICKNCNDAIHCDKFYINVQNKATLTIGRDFKTKGLIRKSFYGKTQKEAIDKMYKYNFSIEQDIPLTNLVYNKFATISTIANEIEEAKYRIGKTKANAYNTNMFTLNRIKNNKFANIPIRDVTKRQLEDFLEKERVKSNSTIKKDYRMLKNVFDYAKQKMYININFFEGINCIETPKSLKEDRDIVALTIKEQKKLEDYLKTYKDNKKNIILLCLYTGMRIGEVLALNYINDIDLDSKMIKISKTLTRDKKNKTSIGPTKTKNGKRNIEINELTENIIINSINNLVENENNLLFCKKNGMLYNDNDINSAFKRMCKNAGITKAVNTHMLRHTFATRCIEAAVDLAVLQKLMGHANIETTINIYGDIYNYYKQKETQKVINYLRKEKCGY